MSSSATTASALARDSAETETSPGSPTGVTEYPSPGLPTSCAGTNCRMPAGDDQPTVAAADQLYADLTAAGVETLYDDRDERGGVKLTSMDLTGLPWQLIVGPRGIACGTVELKNRRTGEREELSLDSVRARLTQ